MVGVRTSKGCALCLKRSVKCDEIRPSCSQCRRGGRTCPGYARGMKFVDEGPKLRRQTRSAKVRVSRAIPVKSAEMSPSDSSTSGDFGSTDTSRAGSRAAYDQRFRRHDDPIFHQLSSTKLESNQIISSFISAMFPLGVASAQRSFLGSWLWHLPPRLGCSVALDHAALSLALAYFARVSGDRAIFRSAELSYTRALRNLAADIADARKQFSSEVLCATLLLGHYETFVNPSHAWIRHAGGAARLMQIRGARRCYESAFEYSMFLTCRGAIISEALASGQPCFLDTEEWRAIPDGLIKFPLLPEFPELHHLIFGYFAAIPGLRKKVKLLSDDTNQSVRRSILLRAQTLRWGFQQWYHQYSSIGGGMRQPLLLDVSPVSDDHLFQSSYVYSDVLTASVIITYYAYLILLNQDIDRLQQDRTHSEESLELGTAICMSIDYCYSAGYCGIQTMRFSLPIARLALPAKYHGWLEAWMERFSDISESTKIQPPES